MVLAVGFGVANGRPRNRKNIGRRLTCSNRLRYIQSGISRFTSREAQKTGVSVLCLTQSKGANEATSRALEAANLGPSIIEVPISGKDGAESESAPASDSGSVGENMTSERTENDDKSRSKTWWPFGRQSN